MTPHDEAAAILNHYFAQLARAAGLRWSDRNQADIERATQLLCQAEAPAGDEIPPYRPVVSERQTLVLDRDELASGDYGDPQFKRWRREKQEQERATQRMLEREERAR